LAFLPFNILIIQQSHSSTLIFFQAKPAHPDLQTLSSLWIADNHLVEEGINVRLNVIFHIKDTIHYLRRNVEGCGNRKRPNGAFSHRNQIEIVRSEMLGMVLVKVDGFFDCQWKVTGTLF